MSRIRTLLSMHKKSVRPAFWSYGSSLLSVWKLLIAVCLSFLMTPLRLCFTSVTSTCHTAVQCIMWWGYGHSVVCTVVTCNWRGNTLITLNNVCPTFWVGISKSPYEVADYMSQEYGCSLRHNRSHWLHYLQFLPFLCVMPFGSSEVFALHFCLLHGLPVPPLP